MKCRKKQQAKAQEYEALFIKESSVAARMGKMVYIRREFHDMLKTLCNVGNNGITLSGYIDNVLAHHIETYENEMNRLYAVKHKGLNINKIINPSKT